MTIHSPSETWRSRSLGTATWSARFPTTTPKWSISIQVTATSRAASLTLIEDIFFGSYTIFMQLSAWYIRLWEMRCRFVAFESHSWSWLLGTAHNILCSYLDTNRPRVTESQANAGIDDLGSYTSLNINSEPENPAATASACACLPPVSRRRSPPSSGSCITWERLIYGFRRSFCARSSSALESFSRRRLITSVECAVPASILKYLFFSLSDRCKLV